MQEWTGPSWRGDWSHALACSTAKSKCLYEFPTSCVSVCSNHFICINSLTSPNSPLRWIFCYHHPHFTDEKTKAQGDYLPKVTQLVTTKLRPKPRQPVSESVHPTTLQIGPWMAEWEGCSSEPQRLEQTGYVLEMLPGWGHCVSGQKGFPAKAWLGDLSFIHKQLKGTTDHH